MSETKAIALITGAGKRIGYHLALSLAKEGWSIAAHYNQSEQGALKLRDEIKALGSQSITLKADLKNDQDVLSLVAKCQTELGQPTLLINCASVFEKDELQTLTPDIFDEQMAVNLKAPLLLSKTFAEAYNESQSNSDEANNHNYNDTSDKIRDDNIGANIINITDQRVHKLNPSFFSYTLTKVGLSAATITMAQALAPTIRVNAIAPGPVMQSIHQTKAEFENECKGTLLGAGTSPEEIFAAVQFILKTKSLTGETITLAGGQHLKW